MDYELKKMDGVEIWDTTLREGEQQRDIHFTLDQKMEIADALLNRLKMAVNIEIHCYKHTFEEAKAIVDRFGKEKVILHHRLLESDLDISRRCGKKAQAGMFLGTSNRHLKSLNLTKEDALDKLERTLEYAYQYGLKVGKLTFEDAPGTDIDFLRDLCRVVDKSRVEVLTICPAQSVERYRPGVYGRLMGKMMEFTDIPLLTHCHNDRGLSVAACLAAYDVGVRRFNTSVLGLGERSGITPLEQLLLNFKLEGIDVDTTGIWEICNLVRRYTGISPAPHTPVIGSNVYAHKAGAHVRKVMVDPSTYEACPPEIVGRKGRVILISHLSGASSIMEKLKNDYGITHISGDAARDIAERVREYGMRWKGDVSTHDFEEIVAERLGIRIEDLIALRKFPQEVFGIFFVNVDPEHRSDVGRRIRREVREATSICEIMGSYIDLKVEVTTSSLERLEEYTRMIKGLLGVKDVKSYIIVKKY